MFCPTIKSKLTWTGFFREFLLETTFLFHSRQQQLFWLVVWLPFFIFPYIGNNHPNWRSYFSEGWPNHQPAIVWSTVGVFHQRLHTQILNAPRSQAEDVMGVACAPVMAYLHKSAPALVRLFSLHLGKANPSGSLSKKGLPPKYHQPTGKWTWALYWS